eukprot:TRINITY_DN0_c1214_g1_i1.p1 TRINITY_DN0_c1214_g1~~TRINITY_DN0_c1214_g1_i1.p1  ORF type:complete len:193 (+),score=60.13 TRINITY_DN0_c1214_g1_i1:82-660(+)
MAESGNNDAKADLKKVDLEDTHAKKKGYGTDYGYQVEGVTDLPKAKEIKEVKEEASDSMSKKSSNVGDQEIIVVKDDSKEVKNTKESKTKNEDDKLDTDNKSSDVVLLPAKQVSEERKEPQEESKEGSKTRSNMSKSGIKKSKDPRKMMGAYTQDRGPKTMRDVENRQQSRSVTESNPKDSNDKENPEEPQN